MAAILKMASHGVSTRRAFGDFGDSESGDHKEHLCKNPAFYHFFPGYPIFGANAPGLYAVFGIPVRPNADI